MNWRKRKKELDKKYEYFWNHIGIERMEKINPTSRLGIALDQKALTLIEYYADRGEIVNAQKIILENLENEFDQKEKKGMATLKDLLIETYDIFVEGNIYFCVPKNGMINQDYEYEERDIAELNCEIGQVDGFNTDELELAMVSSTGIVALTTAWRPSVIENPELPQGRIMEWTDKKGITDNAGMNSGANT